MADDGRAEILALSDPLLGARMNLPGVSRWVRLRLLRNVACVLGLVGFACLLLAFLLQLAPVGLAAALLTGVGLVAAAILWAIESVVRVDATLPGQRAVTPR